MPPAPLQAQLHRRPLFPRSGRLWPLAFRRKLYHPLEELQTDLDAWLEEYNTNRTHQGKMCCGRTPMQTLLDGKAIWEEKVGQLN